MKKFNVMSFFSFVVRFTCLRLGQLLKTEIGRNWEGTRYSREESEGWKNLPNGKGGQRIIRTYKEIRALSGGFQNREQ